MYDWERYINTIESIKIRFANLDKKKIAKSSQSIVSSCSTNDRRINRCHFDVLSCIIESCICPFLLGLIYKCHVYHICLKYFKLFYGKTLLCIVVNFLETTSTLRWVARCIEHSLLYGSRMITFRECDVDYRRIQDLKFISFQKS